MTAVPEPLAAAAGPIVSITFDALQKLGYEVSESNVSQAKISEVVNFAYRDLERIAHDLNNKVSREKYAAYHAFWFSKVKPIQSIMRPDGAGEVVDINERIAVIIALELMLIGAGPQPDVESYPAEMAEAVGFDSPPAPLVWARCPRKCNGACFESGSRNYLKYHKNQNYEYIVKSLRYRAAGPYSLVNFLEAVTISSCNEIRENPAEALNFTLPANDPGSVTAAE